MECVEDVRDTDRILVGRSEGKRKFVRSRCREEDNIKMNFQEIGWGVIVRIELAQGRDRWWEFMNAVMNRRVS